MDLNILKIVLQSEPDRKVHITERKASVVRYNSIVQVETNSHFFRGCLLPHTFCIGMSIEVGLLGVAVIFVILSIIKIVGTLLATFLRSGLVYNRCSSFTKEDELFRARFFTYTVFTGAVIGLIADVALIACMFKRWVYGIYTWAVVIILRSLGFAAVGVLAWVWCHHAESTCAMCQVMEPLGVIWCLGVVAAVYISLLAATFGFYLRIEKKNIMRRISQSRSFALSA